MRNLASIQIVRDVIPIPEADNIEQLKVLGWSLVAKKGEFKPGNYCVFFEIDSILPKDNPIFSFMEASGYRVKTRRMRGVLSQGLALPIDIVFNTDHIIVEGLDVAEELGIVKWEPTIDVCLGGDAVCQWPFGSSPGKTDETRVQSAPEQIINSFKGKSVYVTTKMDGSSGTFGYLDGTFHCCSRNLSLKESEKSAFWIVAKKYNLPTLLKDSDLVVQGEAIGESIQKNRIGIKGVDLCIFNIYDRKTKEYLDYFEMKKICETFQWNSVPTEYIGEFYWNNMDELLEFAKGEYKSGHPKEGIVIRLLDYNKSDCHALGYHGSFKVINNDFLLKTKE